MAKKQKSPRQTAKPDPPAPDERHPMFRLIHAVKRIYAIDGEIAGVGIAPPLSEHRDRAVDELSSQITVALDALDTLQDECAAGYPQPWGERP